MGLNKTTKGSDALVYIIDVGNKKVLDVVKYKHCNEYGRYYREMFGVRTTSSYYPYLHEYLEDV